MVRFGIAVTSGVLLGLAGAYAQGTPGPTINVQVIEVCADDGTQCALSGPGASLAYNPAAIKQVFNQAGITVNLLAPVQFDSSAYLNPAVIDDPARGYLTGSPLDPAHQLLNTPGHDQSTNVNVLNLFLVNSLPHTAADGTPSSLLYGLGLQNANGAVVTTGLTPTATPGVYSVAGIDNIAHELGHNLGLIHVDQAPLAGTTVAAGPSVTAPAPPGTYTDAVPVDTAYNLMDGTGRIVPRTVCGIYGTACDAAGNIVAAGSPTAATVGIKDQLLPFQTQQLQQSAVNLFTVNLASATAADDSGCADPASSSCSTTITYNPSSSTESLVGIKLRYRPTGRGDAEGSLQFGFLYNGNGAGTTPAGCDPVIADTFLPTGGLESQLTVDAACLLPGAQVTLMAGGNEELHGFAPFSAEFDFSDGVTSRALFDSSGTAQSTLPVAIGNLDNPFQNGPGLTIPTDPTAFNRTVQAEDDGGQAVAADGTAVPEPATAGVFGLGALALALRRRRIR